MTSPDFSILDDILCPLDANVISKSFLVFLPGGDQSSPGRVRRPVGFLDLFRPEVSFQHLPPALANTSGFLVSLSTTRSALGGSSAISLHL